MSLPSPTSWSSRTGAAATSRTATGSSHLSSPLASVQHAARSPTSRFQPHQDQLHPVSATTSSTTRTTPTATTSTQNHTSPPHLGWLAIACSKFRAKSARESLCMHFYALHAICECVQHFETHCSPGNETVKIAVEHVEHTPRVPF